ncbi:ABC transporter permease [Tsukamurella sp. 8F]|uniref:ABC transporter permease n=1 Tax=unclassified Tsukamurella TaxID=2633480 RepID=UPI0023B9E499|nr:MULTISPECIES: ABC transporter permease [unclassified Tsukamurella]MDF0528517.1 ABC transporter permease [Tsukamurella sp. 8J]MDF0586343.1 ABC transporter permease [Tsukamurella sp. 8F]
MTRKLIGVLIALCVAIPLLLLMFTGPASRANPHDLPVGVAGPGAAQAAAALQEREPGAFEVHTYATPAELQQAARDREVYGGVATGAEPQTVIATGASPVAAQMLTQIGTQASQGRAQVVDVAPASADDPRGAGFGSMVMPVFLTGVVLALAATFLGRRASVVALALPVGALAVGAAAIATTSAIGVLPGGFVAQWLALSAGILAIAAAVAGFVALVGLPGVGIGAALFLIVGMPLSGIAMPPEFLPHIWGTLGQWLPLGATGSALRSAAFFGGTAGAGGAFLALGAWIVAGYCLLAIGAARHHGSATDHELEGGETTESREKSLPQPATM